MNLTLALINLTAGMVLALSIHFPKHQRLAILVAAAAVFLNAAIRLAAM